MKIEFEIDESVIGNFQIVSDNFHEVINVSIEDYFSDTKFIKKSSISYLEVTNSPLSFGDLLKSMTEDIKRQKTQVHEYKTKKLRNYEKALD